MEDDATAAAEDALSKVLRDDDLLAEILLRVGFPTTLVRAAAVCKRWLHLASDPAFLCRFRKLNQPRLLGFYVQGLKGSLFVPVLPQPPELAAAVRIVERYSFGAGYDRVLVQDCRNGNVFVVLRGRYELSVGMHNPLCPQRATAIDQYRPVPGPPSFQILSREEKGGDLSYFCVSMEFSMKKEAANVTKYFRARVYMLQDGVWCMHASAKTQIPGWQAELQAVLVDNKVFMTVTSIDITVLDLTTSSFSTIQFPQGVASDFVKLRGDDYSSVYLTEMKELQLRIWIYKGDGWSIVDTICLGEMCANLMMSDCRVKDARTSLLRINHVGDNAQFVLLQMGKLVLYLDMRCRTLCTLYKMPEDEPDRGSINIRPFMMIWPPKFPVRRSIILPEMPCEEGRYQEALVI